VNAFALCASDLAVSRLKNEGRVSRKEVPDPGLRLTSTCYRYSCAVRKVNSCFALVERHGQIRAFHSVLNQLPLPELEAAVVGAAAGAAFAP